MPFSETVTKRDFRKKIQSTEAYTNNATLRSGFFLQTRSVTVFPGFTEMVQVTQSVQIRPLTMHVEIQWFFRCTHDQEILTWKP